MMDLQHNRHRGGCGGDQEFNLASCISDDTVLTLHHAPTMTLRQQDSNLIRGLRRPICCQLHYTLAIDSTRWNYYKYDGFSCQEKRSQIVLFHS